MGDILVTILVEGAAKAAAELGNILLYPFGNNKDSVYSVYSVSTINDIFRLPRPFQIIKFFELKNDYGDLDNFIKLRENKNAMSLLYRLFKNKKEKISLDEFLKTNPDFELQYYFYSFTLCNKVIAGGLLIDETDFLKLDEKTQIIICKNLLKLDGIYDIKQIEITKQYYDIIPLIKEGNYINNIENILKTNTDYKFQSILYFLVLEFHNYQDNNNLFLQLNKKSQIIIMKICGKFEIFEILNLNEDKIRKIDIEVLIQLFIKLDDKEINYKNFNEIFKEREELAFKDLPFEIQLKLIEDSPKEKKEIFFSILPDKYRKKEILSKIKDINYKIFEKYLVDNENK